MATKRKKGSKKKKGMRSKHIPIGILKSRHARLGRIIKSRGG